MPISIKNAAVERSIRELSAATGESLTVAIRVAVEDRLQRVRRVRNSRGLAKDLLAIGARCSALPDFETGSADEILGYDADGLPS